MTRRTKQTTTAVRKDVTVTLQDGSHIRHKDALGWSLVNNSEVLIILGDRVQDGDKLVNETLALYRQWSHVSWSA